jgi:Toprim-like
LTMADLFPDRPTRNGGKAAIVATYDYRDEGGNLLFQVCRFDPKDFRQRRPDATQADGWTWSTKGVRRVLYRLPETLAAVQRGQVIHLAEGEKDVAALVQAGFAATCNASGAGKWRTEYTAALKGAGVVIVADKDSPGRKHAADVAAQLRRVAASVKVIELPDVNGKPVKDAADFFAAGGTAADFKSICEQVPEWTAPAQPAPADALAASEAAAAPDGGDFGRLTAWIRGEIVALLLNKDLAPGTRRSLIAKKVVEALCKLGRFYFHADLRDFNSAMFFDSQRKRLERIRSDAFGAWLSGWLNVNRADPLFRFITAEVEGAALSETYSRAIIPEAFWAARPGAVYLSNSDGQVVKVTGDAVALADNGCDGVLFAAGRTLAPWKLCAPEDPFECCSLFHAARCRDGHGPDLLRVWCYSLPTLPRSKPPLVLTGDVGSGKTRTAKGFTELYGLPFLAHKIEERGESQFFVCLDQGGVFIPDNVDTRNRWLADAISNAATDGCSMQRRLYTNSETVILRARAWLVVTSANPSFANDAGLADRLIVVRMERRGDETGDAVLTEEILKHRDAGLSHIACTLQTALADSRPTPPGLNARHPDFASFAVKIGRALGREAETVTALQSAEQDKSAFCLENDGIAAALLAYLSSAGTFTGTAAELVPHLIAIDSELTERLSAKRLGKRLAALWPHLEKALPGATKSKDSHGFTLFNFGAGDQSPPPARQPEMFAPHEPTKAAPPEPEAQPVSAAEEELV